MQTIFNQSGERFGAMMRGYVACLLWTMPGDDGDENPGDRYSDSDLSHSARIDVRAACVEFLSRVERAGLLPVVDGLRAVYSDGRLGHDLALSRNGHGAGFFDRDELPEGLRDELQRIAESMRASDLYVGDDGQLYAE